MQVVFYLILTWIFAAFFLFQRKSLTLVENLFLFFFFLFINKNVITMLSLNLSMIEYSKEPHLFICFWFQRTLIYPLLLLIFVNRVFEKSTMYKFGGVLLFIGIGILIELIAIKLEVISYTNWNFGWTFLISIVYLCTTLGIAKVFRYFILREGEWKG
ncbi:hypothetical protein ACFVAD_15690 [Sutcliffiella sp. NPDC057660]|uniref:hypothetical protein n=1 Tax=Sutcliffiella sp. NPDC057660 TaxID=3346199 RepID=UPI00368D0930